MVAVIQHHLQDLTERQPGGEQGHHIVELQRIGKCDLVTGHHILCIVVAVGVLFIVHNDGLEHPHATVSRSHYIAREVDFPIFIIIVGRFNSLR